MPSPSQPRTTLLYEQIGTIEGTILTVKAQDEYKLISYLGFRFFHLSWTHRRPSTAFVTFGIKQVLNKLNYPEA
jgi:hypothetical protein